MLFDQHHKLYFNSYHISLVSSRKIMRVKQPRLGLYILETHPSLEFALIVFLYVYLFHTLSDTRHKGSGVHAKSRTEEG
jgi:hypothetical protein